MLLEESDAIERIQSPLNLLNRLRTATRTGTQVPSLPPSASDIVKDLDERLAYGSIKSKANAIAVSALEELRERLPEVTKAKELATIAEQMNKIANVLVAGSKDDNNTVIGQVIIYAPQIIEEEKFEIVDVSKKE